MEIPITTAYAMWTKWRDVLIPLLVTTIQLLRMMMARAITMTQLEFVEELVQPMQMAMAYVT
jgi:hypothetical protein